MRLRPFLQISFALAMIAAPTWVRANHFEVALTVTDGQNTQTGKTETEPPPKARDVVVRPVMQSAFGTRCTATWKVTCHNSETLKDVVIHFYVVRIDKHDQASPSLNWKEAEIVIETGEIMDFPNRTNTSAQLQFLPAHPGIYLVRIETLGTAEVKGHEHYAAIEVVVK